MGMLQSFAPPVEGKADLVEEITRIVDGWPHRFDPQRAIELGFRVEKDFDEIIRTHIEEDLGGKIAA